VFKHGEQTHDSGLKAFVTLAQFHQVAADAQQLQHQFSPHGELFDIEAMQHAAKAVGLRCRVVKKSIPDLARVKFPVIAKTEHGQFFIIAKRQPPKESNEEKNALRKTTYYLVQNMDNTIPEQWDELKLNEQWNGELVLLGQKGLSGIEALKSFDISWFIPALIKYRKLFTEVLIASVFIQIFALLTPLFFQVVMDKVLVHRGFTTLDVLAIGFFAVIIFEAILAGVRQYTLTHTTHRVDVDLGTRLYKHLIALPQSWFETRQVGQSVARVKELDSLRNFITGSALTLTIDLAFTFIFFAVLYYYSPTLSMIVLSALPFYIILSIFITPILRKRLEQQFQYGAKNQAFLVESISGIQTVKSMAVEPQMQRRWEDQLAKSVTSAFRAGNVSNIAEQCANVISKITTLFIIWIGAHLVINGELSVGQLVAFNMIAGRISAPILKLVQLWQDFQQAGISIRRLGDILNTPTEPGFDASRTTLPSMDGAVKFDHIRFRYRPDGPTILEDINLDVQPGERIGIVGRSGSGKSTLTKLIQRLYVPESGRILVDGADLAEIDTPWLRRNIGVVLQENYLFHRSVRENIALINPAIEMDQVISAAKLAGAHEFIMALPKAYDTIVDEQASNFSGGQRQRIAIARALVGDPKILIFDEATSALDYESERVIQDNMSAISESRTVFIIAHRLSAIKHCDRIIVMDNGRIVEQGDHHQLIRLDSVYASLYHLQHNSKPHNKNSLPSPTNDTKHANNIRVSGGLNVVKQDGKTVVNTMKPTERSE